MTSASESRQRTVPGNGNFSCLRRHDSIARSILPIQLAGTRSRPAPLPAANRALILFVVTACDSSHGMSSPLIHNVGDLPFSCAPTISHSKALCPSALCPSFIMSAETQRQSCMSVSCDEEMKYRGNRGEDGIVARRTGFWFRLSIRRQTAEVSLAKRGLQNAHWPRNYTAVIATHLPLDLRVSNSPYNR
jgi:hypothetical protein